jgi:hypothetical protein
LRVQEYDESLRVYRDVFSFYGVASDVRQLGMTAECANGMHMACPKIQEIHLTVGAYSAGMRKAEFYLRSRCRCECHGSREE